MPDSGSAAGTDGPGKLLREARAKRGLSVEQVSERMHVGRHIVEAVEGEQWDVLGAAVYVKGHLRSYARVVELDEAPVLAAYGADDNAPSAAPEIAVPAGARYDFNPLIVVGVTIMAVLLAGLLWYAFGGAGGDDAAPVPRAESVAANEARDEPEAAPEPAAAPEPVAAPEPAFEPEPVFEPDTRAGPEPRFEPGPSVEPGTLSEPGLPPEPDPAVPAAAVASAPRAATQPPDESTTAAPMALRFVFEAESWAEVEDADGRLLIGLQPAGTEREVTGRPPVSVLIGNSEGASVWVDGESYPLPGRRRPGGVARFTIEAPPP